MKALEIVLNYACECRCIFCPSPDQPQGAGFREDTTRKLIDWGRSRGAGTLWFNGGEPCVRPDLPALIAGARRSGYEDIRIKTNGISLSDPERVATLVGAGATYFSVSVWGLGPEVHDSLSGHQGAWQAMNEGVQNLARAKARVGADILMTSRSGGSLGEIVTHLSDLGVREFTYSLVSLYGMNGKGLESLLPRMSDVVPALRESVEMAEKRGPRAIRVQHVPPCLLGPAARHAFDVVGEDLLVITPGGRFMLQESPFMGGIKPKGCAGCKYHGRCLGLRQDYVKVWGEKEPRAVRNGNR